MSAKPMKTPGVYIVEKSAFPNSVVEVATAVPAFIGHTEKADNQGKSLRNKPWRISSMVEFEQYFGGPPLPKFSIEKVNKEGAEKEAEEKAKVAEEAGERAKQAAAEARKAAEAAKEAQQRAKATTDPAESAKASKEADDKSKAAKEAEDKSKQADEAARKADEAAKEAAKKAQAEKGATAGATQADFTFDKTDYILEQAGGKYLLYYSMSLFYQNGGGPCYIVSVGGYDDEIDAEKFTNGIDTLIKEQEPTMLLIPEAMLLKGEVCVSVQQAMLNHCGYKMKNRVAVLDIYDGYRDRKDPAGDCIKKFREGIGINQLDFGTAYYPWIHTTIILDKDLGCENFEDSNALRDLLKNELDKRDDPKKDEIAREIDKISKPGLPDDEKMLLNKTLAATSPLYGQMLKAIKEKLNLLPPAAAMAGIYTMVDNERGVWKAPANVSLNSVVAPAVNISHDDQEDLNVDVNGKSINAIRAFIGKGNLVWGARTLDGNSLDWRYVSVRRTMIMLEQSIKFAAKAYVFENNVANTWVTMKSMIGNFLNGIWKRGGLAGATPDDAFSVHVGLGETMTPVDILEGILRITVLVAVTRPAEFIEITFQQQMQKS